MKRLFWCILILPAMVFAQNSYTVSNAPGSSANFKTLQGAHDSVAAGSILYVSPSSYSYGNLTLTKKLTIYGTGYFLGQNLEPNTQANAGSVLVNSLTFRPGSDNSFVEGLQLSFQAEELTNRVSLDTVSDIIISRCLIVSPTWGAYGGNHNFFVINGGNNCLIKQCYIQNINGYTQPPLINYGSGLHPNFSGLQFVNNIFDWKIVSSYRAGPYGNEGLTGGVTDAMFMNNTFIMAIKNSLFGNLNYTNNIFINTDPAGIPDPSSLQIKTALYNVTNAPAMFSTPGNNLHGANTDSMFTGSLPGYHSIDQQWILRDTSFANTFGQGGTAVGAFGGNNSYKLSGIPSIPFIYGLTVPAQATAPGTISVHIKARPTN